MLGTASTIKAIQDGAYDARFALLYADQQDVIWAQRQRYINAIQQFTDLYGERDTLSLYSTPGRTEIGGNHTDHNNGVVMAAAVNLDLIAVVSAREDHLVRLTSEGFSENYQIDLGQLEPVSGELGKSSSLIRGVAAGIVQNGGKVGGFDAYATSDVLQGSGLSSSAAFEVCIGAVLNHEFNQGRFSPVQLGMIGQFAENVFFGKPSGLMDQTACAVGSAITIDFEKPGHPVVEKIPFDLAGLGFKLVITDTKGSHADLTDEYAAIRGEMEQVARFFGKDVLRQVDPEHFYSRIAEVRAAAGDRAVLRTMHFFEECRRAKKLALDARNQDIQEFLSTIIESGHSSFEYNQNAYSVKHPTEQGVSLGLALSQQVLAGQGAWRLQGGGFAGTIQAFVPDDVLEEYCDTLGRVFGEDACYVLTVRGIGCTKVEPIGH